MSEESEIGKNANESTEIGKNANEPIEGEKNSNDPIESGKNGNEPIEGEKNSNDPIEGERNINELVERVKELDCFYGISSVIQDKNIAFHDALQKIIDLIPPAWQHSDIACSRIIVEGEEIKTANFAVTPWVQSCEMKIKGEVIGVLEVYYLEKRPVIHEGPFLAEERRLINAIAELLVKFTEERRMVEELKESREKLNSGNGSMNGSENGEDMQSKKQDWEIIIELLVKTDPRTLLRITRRMMYHLYRLQNERMTILLDTLSPISTEAGTEWCGINIPNPKQSIDMLRKIQQEVFEIARETLPAEEISELFHNWLIADKARPLLLASQQRGISLTEISEVLNRYWDQPRESRFLAPEDDMTIRSALIARFFTDRLEYINIAKGHIEIEDFVKLLRNVIGPAQGDGKLGGKSSGIYLAEKLIEKEKENDEILNDVAFAKSWYLTSDSLVALIHYNDLDDISHIKYLDPDEIRVEQPFLEQLFKNSTFPSEIIEGLKKILRDLGDQPIIVRSSSLLEDSYGAAFSGKYKSLFLVNAGTEEERLSNLMNAISEVYASTFGPDPIQYRKERGLLSFSEGMGILIQQVVGKRIGPYFMPAFAGVAFTNNEFRWSPRIRRDDGIIRMVAGLGTRAVDRIGNDYPVLVSPNRPKIRVNTMVDESIQYSQRYLDVINMEKETLETLPTSKIFMEYWDEYPLVDKIVSIHKDGILTPANSILMDPKTMDVVVDPSGLFEKSQFIPQIKRILSLLKEKLGTPVDVEFAHDGSNLYILQCRPQSQSYAMERVPIPKNIHAGRKLFSANKYVTTSHIENIEYIVYVDPEGYEALKSREDMLAVARAVGALNNYLPKRKFILMGPGRWGSRGDIKLGVPVIYNDLNNTSLLIEIARKKGGYLPDLSFGTHFFQDLVEADIHYLPLYPDESDIIFNEGLLDIGRNHLAEMIPRFKDLENVVRVISASDLSSGGTISVVMDGEANMALAYLVAPDHWVWRMKKVEMIADELDCELYGVEALYIFGSTEEATAGPNSDIDLLVHFRGNEDQKEGLLSWFHEWDIQLDEEFMERAGTRAGGLLDIHIISDEDIAERNSWAAHIGSLDSPARKIPLKNYPHKE